MQTSRSEYPGFQSSVPLIAFQRGFQFSSFRPSLSSKPYLTLGILIATFDTKDLAEEVESWFRSMWNG